MCSEKLSPAAWRKADWDNTTGRSPSRQLVGEVYLRTLDRHPLMPISGLITFTRLAAVPPAPFGGNLSLDPATVGAHFLPPRYSAVENVPNLCEFAIPSNHRYLPAMRDAFDPEDFSFVVKMRGAPPKPWAWEIHRARKSGPVERSSVFYTSMAEAVREGKKALARILIRAPAQRRPVGGASMGRNDRAEPSKSRIGQGAQ